MKFILECFSEIIGRVDTFSGIVIGKSASIYCLIVGKMLGKKEICRTTCRTYLAKSNPFAVWRIKILRRCLLGEIARLCKRSCVLLEDCKQDSCWDQQFCSTVALFCYGNQRDVMKSMTSAWEASFRGTVFLLVRETWIGGIAENVRSRVLCWPLSTLVWPSAFCRQYRIKVLVNEFKRVLKSPLLNKLLWKCV